MWMSWQWKWNNNIIVNEGPKDRLNHPWQLFFFMFELAQLVMFSYYAFFLKTKENSTYPRYTINFDLLRSFLAKHSFRRPCKPPRENEIYLKKIDWILRAVGRYIPSCSILKTSVRPVLLKPLLNSGKIKGQLNFILKKVFTSF